MRQKMLLALGLVMVIMLLVMMGGVSASPAPAEAILAGRPRLDNYQIYFTEANTEASRFDRSDVGLSRLGGLLERLGANMYTLEWRNGIPADADLIIIAGPVGDFTPEQTARLWAYLTNQGGRLLVLADPLINKTKAFPSNKGLFELTWTDLGIRAMDNILVTEGEMRTIVPEPEEVDEGEPTSTPAPAFEAPILLTDFVSVNLATGRPLTQNIDGGLAFFGARALEVDESFQITEASALVFANSNFYGETDFNDYLNTGAVTYLPGEEDTPRGMYPVAAVAQNPETGMRIVLIGDRDFATNGKGLQTAPANSPSFVYPGNVGFLLNAITWLLDAEAVEMSFPTPGPTGTPTLTPTPELETE